MLLNGQLGRRGLSQTAGGEVLRSMGLCDDEGRYPLSPKSENAFQHISRQFDALYQKMKQNEVESNGKVWSPSHFPLAFVPASGC